jgi:hypothetical protein
MDHTSELLRTITGHAERVHVYESLLQMAKSLSQETVTTTTNNDQEEEDEFALQVQANILRLRALKTYHMAWYYYQQPRKYQKALALVQHSQKLSKRAQEEISACDEDMPHADQYLRELENLPIPSAQAAMQAALYLQQGGGKNSRRRGETNNARSTNRPLLLRLQDDDPGMVLADDDLLPMPIPCKPVFYDLAYDYATDSSQGIAAIRSYVNKHTVQPEPEEDDDDDDANKGGSSFMGWLTGSK